MKNITLLSGMLLTSLFSFAQPPSNDDCAGAIALTVNADGLCGTITAGTTLGATASAQTDDVTGYPNNDVWYTFVATGTRHFISLRNIVDLDGDDESDMGIGVYSGDCAALTYEDDSDPESFSVSGLVAGTTYYVRVYGWDEASNAMSFNICIGSPTVYAAPENDECVGAIGLTVNPNQLCGVVTRGTTAGGTPSAQDPSQVTGTPNNDVWYSFVATGTDHRISLSNIEDLNGDFESDMGMALYSGDCAALEFEETSDPETLNAIDLVAGTTYYLRVYGWGSDTNPMSFDICIGSPLVSAPPANDECDGAITLNAGSDACASPTAGTTAGGTPSAQDPSEVSGTPANDVWFTFVATATEHRVTVGNIVNLNGDSSTDMGIAIYTGSCNALTFVDTSDPESFTVEGLTVGDTYYVRVYGWSENSDPMSFGICVSSQGSVPDNDDCSGATVATLPYTHSQDASAATNGSGFVGCDGDDMNDGVWYTFTGNGSDIEIAVSPFGWDPEIGVYTGDCSGLVCEGSVDNGSAGDRETYLVENSRVGVTYYVNVGYYSGSNDSSEGPFSINISSPLAVPGFDMSNFKAYPNPVKDVLNLDYIQDITSVSAYNLLGQQMLSVEINSSKGQLDMSGLAAGSYLVKVIAGDQSKTIKVIKQ